MNIAQPDASAILIFFLLLLSPLSLASLALMNAGLGRSRSVAQSLLGSLMVVATAGIAFALIGYALVGAPGSPSLTLILAAKPWDILSFGPFLLHTYTASTFPTQLTFLYQCFAASLSALIPWGSGADRLRLIAGCAIAALFGLLLFPLCAHWTSSGWLAQLGIHFSLGSGFLDPGGAASIHALGGLCALAVIWTTGPRKGKFPHNSIATAIPGHNAAYILLACFMALIGFIAFNLAGNLLWLHASLIALPTVVLSTLLCASGALLAAFFFTRIRFTKPDASLCGNAWLAGLVTSSAIAGIVPPLAALFVGILTGILTPLLIELLELALSIDDPSGAVVVHAAAALLGLLAVGIFAPQTGQFAAQLTGIAALLGFFLPAACLLFAILNRVIPFRVESEGERIGMDLFELGGNAYPEFMIHRDDSDR